MRRRCAYIYVLTGMCAVVRASVRATGRCARPSGAGAGDCQMRSCVSRQAEATGGVQLAGKPKPDGHRRSPGMWRSAWISEAHRPVVESVSVLFELYDGTPTVMPRPGAGAQLLPGHGHGGEIRGVEARRPAAGGFGAFTFRVAAKLSTGAWA